MENLSLNARRDRLSEAKRLLLVKRLRGETGGDAASHSSVQWNRARRRSPRSSECGSSMDFYPDQRCIIFPRLIGWADVSTSRPEESLNVIISRHEALRTTFASEDGVRSRLSRPSCG